MSPTITVTEAAAHKIADIILGPEAGESAGLRIFVKGGGCSGLQYGFELIDAAQADDLVIERGGVTLFVDHLSSLYLDGATIDYVREGFNSFFSISNPNVKTTCGCGSSFSA